MRKRKILALTTDKGFGGAERVFNTLNKALLQDYDVSECYFNGGKNSYYESPCKEYSLDVEGGGGLFWKIFHFIQRIYRFRQLIKHTGADIVISHLEGADYVALLSGTSAKKVCVIHGTKYGDKKITGFYGLVRKKLMIPLVYALADRIVTVSESLVEEVRQHVKINPRKVLCIYNSIDQDHIQLELSEPIDDVYEHIFLHKTLIVSSRLDDVQKNLCGLIDIFRQVAKVEDVRLVIVGDGPDRNMIIDYAKQNGLTIASIWERTLTDRDADVYFLGYQSNPFSYISRADLFMLTSYYEGFPLSLLEAMACNTAVIASDCPTGPAEILEGERITYLDELEAKAYAGALLPIPFKEDKETISLWSSVVFELLENEALRNKIRQEGQERIEALSPSRIYAEWKRLISEMD